MNWMSGGIRSHEITAEKWEAYWQCRNACGLVCAHEDYIVRIATLLSKQYPGLLFLWDCPGASTTAMISVVRPDKHKIASRVEAQLVSAAERIAQSVANQEHVAHGPLDRLFRRHLKPGWQYAAKHGV